MKTFFSKTFILCLAFGLFFPIANTRSDDSWASHPVVVYLDSLDNETRALVGNDILAFFYDNPEGYPLIFVKNVINDYLEQIKKEAPKQEEEEQQQQEVKEKTEKELIQELLDGLSDIEKQVMPKDEQQLILQHYSFEDAEIEINYWKGVAAKRVADRKEIKIYLASLDSEILKLFQDETIYNGKAKEFIDNLDDYTQDAPPLDYVHHIVNNIKRHILIEEENKKLDAQLKAKQKVIDDYLDSLDPAILDLVDPFWIAEWRNPDIDHGLEEFIKPFIQEILDAPRPLKPDVLTYAFNNDDEEGERILPVVGFKFKNMDQYTTDPTGKDIEYECQIRVSGTNEWIKAPHYPGYVPPGTWNFYYGAIKPFEVRFRIVDWVLVSGNGDSGKVTGSWSDPVEITKAYYPYHMNELIEDEANPEYYGSRPINISQINWNAIFIRLGDDYRLWEHIYEAGWEWETGVTEAIVGKLPSLSDQTSREFVDAIDDRFDIIFALETFFKLELTVPEEFKTLFGVN